MRDTTSPTPREPHRPREDRNLPELGKDAPCLGQMLECEGSLFLGLIEQAMDHFSAVDNEALRDQTAFRCLASSIALIGSGCHLETPT